MVQYDCEDWQKLLEAAHKLAEKQAEDEGLWFHAETAPEAYLQQALRELHDVLEVKK